MPHQHACAHQHDHTACGSTRRLGAALVIVTVVFVAEVVGGILSGSLALLADAAHMATDAFALALALIASRLEHRPANARLSYGLRRAPVLAAFVNGLLLFAVALWIIVEAWERIRTPSPILAGPMLAIAIVGLASNGVSLALLRGSHGRGSQGHAHDLNLRGAILHVVSDLLGSLAAIAAAVIILLTGWILADPLLSVLVALLVLWSAGRLVRDAGRILLEAVPMGIDTVSLAADLAAQVPGVHAIHHVHVWSLTPDEPLLTCHAHIEEDAVPECVLDALRHVLANRYGIHHATIEIERQPCRAADAQFRC